MSVLGSVFDVSARTETYGPGGSYGFFSGRDGSRAFHTGQFDQDGLVDRVEDMEDGALDDIHVRRRRTSSTAGDGEFFFIVVLLFKSWLEFFQNSERYSHVGVVEGTYYDRQGAPTDAMRRVEERVKKERSEKLSRYCAISGIEGTCLRRTYSTYCVSQGSEGQGGGGGGGEEETVPAVQLRVEPEERTPGVVLRQVRWDL